MAWAHLSSRVNAVAWAFIGFVHVELVAWSWRSILRDRSVQLCSP